MVLSEATHTGSSNNVWAREVPTIFEVVGEDLLYFQFLSSLSSETVLSVPIKCDGVSLL